MKMLKQSKGLSKIATLLVLFLALFASGCESSGETPPETEIYVEAATDEVLARFDSVNEFIEFEEEGYQKIVIEVNAAVKDFKYIEISAQENSPGEINYETNELFALDELSPQKPFVVTWMNMGALPHRGISFVDKNNATKRFYIDIDMTGEADAPLRLVEF